MGHIQRRPARTPPWRHRPAAPHAGYRHTGLRQCRQRGCMPPSVPWPRLSRAPSLPPSIAAERQIHFVARSAVFNFPDLVTAQVTEAGAGQQHARAVFTQRVRLFRLRREPPAPEHAGLPPCGPRSTILTKDRSLHAQLSDHSCGTPGVWPGRTYRSEEKWSAWGLLVSILALRLLLVGMTVVLSFWNREFFNSLQDKDLAAFFELLFVYRRTPSGFMPGFCEIAAVYILVAVYFTYPLAMAADPLAPLADRALPRRVAGRPRLLPHQPDDRPRGHRHRQPGPAHRRGHARLRRQHAHARHQPAGERGHAGQLPRHPVVAVGHHHAVRHRASPATWSGWRWPTPSSAPG